LEALNDSENHSCCQSLAGGKGVFTRKNLKEARLVKPVEMRLSYMDNNKNRYVMLSITTIIVSTVCWNLFFKFIRIDVTGVSKITISLPYLSPSTETTISTETEIDYIITQLNSFRYKRFWNRQALPQALPDIYITVHFKEDDDVFIFAMYNINNIVYCYSVRNGRRRAFFEIDGEELFYFAIASLKVVNDDPGIVQWLERW